MSSIFCSFELMKNRMGNPYFHLATIACFSTCIACYFYRIKLVNEALYAIFLLFISIYLHSMQKAYFMCMSRNSLKVAKKMKKVVKPLFE